jgi:UDP-N-acetylmuramoyl-L-alanyl-D-glutamate--2,6-diaminopimelate ligase
VTTPDAPEVQRLLAEMRDAGSIYAVVESTSHGLDQERVAAVDFNVAAVTNITHEHLDYHGSHAAYVDAKARLFEMLFAPVADPNTLRCAVLNRDDEVSYSALRRLLIDNESGTSTPVLTYTYGVNLSLTPAADVVATDIVHRSDRTRFRVRWWEGEFDLESFLIGDFNVANILCAATVALALGVPPRAIQAGITSLAGVDGRMERIDRGQSFLALVDFAHSPASLERALLPLRDLVDGGRLIAVFGSAGLRDREKRRLMGAVSGRLADYTIVTAEDPRTEDLDAINREIVAGLQDHARADRYCVISDREAAIQHAVDMAQSGDVVAAFGKGHERSICFGEIEFPWHEQAVMAQALERRMARL